VAWAADRGLTSEQCGFADNIKWAIAKMFWPEIDREAAVYKLDKLKFTSMLHLVDGSTGQLIIAGEATTVEGLQRLGTEFGRNEVNENFWVDQLLPLGADYSNGYADFKIIYDMRFLNELHRVRKIRGRAWLVVGGKSKSGSDDHVSEQGIPPDRYDVVIQNDGSLEALRSTVYQLADKVLL
jgi:hypothetical protein